MAELLRVQETTRLALVSGFLCPETATVSGGVRLSVQDEFRPVVLGRYRAETNPVIIPNTLTAGTTTLRNIGPGTIQSRCNSPVAQNGTCVVAITDRVRGRLGQIAHEQTA